MNTKHKEGRTISGVTLAVGAMKTCGHCEKAKPVTEFARHASNPDGLDHRCRDCMRAYNRSRRSATPEARKRGRKSDAETREARRTRTPEEVEAKRWELHPDGAKPCPRCGLAKPFEAFQKNRTNADGLEAKCRSCKVTTNALRAGKPLRAGIDAYNGEERDLWGRCAICGSDEVVGLDHVIPKPEGSDDAQNLLPLCGAHNRSKGRHSILLFLAEQHPELLAVVAGLPVVNTDGEPIADRFDGVDWSSLEEVAS